jgi:hypothetical protein
VQLPSSCAAATQKPYLFQDEPGGGDVLPQLEACCGVEAGGGARGLAVLPLLRLVDGILDGPGEGDGDVQEVAAAVVAAAFATGVLVVAPGACPLQQVPQPAAQAEACTSSSSSSSRVRR